MLGWAQTPLGARLLRPMLVWASSGFNGRVIHFRMRRSNADAPTRFGFTRKALLHQRVGHRIYVVVVGLETRSLEALKSLTTVVERAPGLRKRHTTDPRYSSQPPSLALDIHDST